MSIEEQAREKQQAYYRQWRAKNKDRIKESNRRYWERRTAKKAADKQETRAV